jgi:hypothetical protein
MDAATAFASLRNAYIKLRDTHGASSILLLSDMLALEHTLLKLSLKCHIQTQESKLNTLSSFSLTNDVEELTKTLRSKLKSTESKEEVIQFFKGSHLRLDLLNLDEDSLMKIDETNKEMNTKSMMDESKE